MAVRRPQRRYGGTRIGGHAKVQLGDRQVIRNTYIQLQHELDLPTLQALKEVLEHKQAVGSLSRAGWSKNNTKPYEDDESEHERRPRFDLRSWCSQLWWASALKTYSRSDRSAIYEDTLITTRDIGLHKLDLPLLFAGIVSYMFRKNVSVERITSFLALCQENQLLGLMTFVLGLRLYQYILTRRLTIAPSCPNPFLLEDAYGCTRPFSIDVCGDYGFFVNFLEFHYRDNARATGQKLIKAGQFQLLLGSRRGQLLDHRNWKAEIFRPGHRLVNSVWVDREETKCLTCDAAMMVMTRGEFHCTACNSFYRDYHSSGQAMAALPAGDADILKHRDSHIHGQPVQTAVENARAEGSWPLFTRLDVQLANGLEVKAEIELDLCDLKNVDLRIKPRLLAPTLMEVVQGITTCLRSYMPRAQLKRYQIAAIFSTTTTSHLEHLANKEAEPLLCGLLSLCLGREKPIEVGRYDHALEQVVRCMSSYWPAEWEGKYPLSAGKTWEDLTLRQRLSVLKALMIWSVTASSAVRNAIAREQLTSMDASQGRIDDRSDFRLRHLTYAGNARDLVQDGLSSFAQTPDQQSSVGSVSTAAGFWSTLNPLHYALETFKLQNQTENEDEDNAVMAEIEQVYRTLSQTTIAVSTARRLRKLNINHLQPSHLTRVEANIQDVEERARSINSLHTERMNKTSPCHINWPAKVWPMGELEKLAILFTRLSIAHQKLEAEISMLRDLSLRNAEHVEDEKSLTAGSQPAKMGTLGF